MFRRSADFRSALRLFLRRSEDISRRHGLTPRQYHLLLEIAGSDDGTATVSSVASRLCIPQSTATELVQRAEQARLVERRVSPNDRRVFHLSVTPDGLLRLSAAHRELGPERAQLFRVMQRLD